MTQTRLRKAFVLLSGGLDSTTCLYFAKSISDEVTAISVDYGQRHKKEMDFARISCNKLRASHKVLSVGGILSGQGVMLTDAAVDIPKVSYDEIQGVSPTYVPFRNGTLLSLITAEAQKWVMQEIENEKGLDAVVNHSREAYGDQWYLEQMKDSVGIFFGAHSEDAANWAYPDCTPEFIGAMGNAIYTGTYYTCRLYTPLQWMSKTQVVRWGNELGVPFRDTWSCYAGGGYHCGECPTCISRHNAFLDAGIPDPTSYEQKPRNLSLEKERA